MPTIHENFTVWEYEWLHDGEEWSAPWGSSDVQWQQTVLPRIQAFLPARSILEIGPGRGRWAERLRHQCEHLTLVDLSPKCIQYCQARFAADTHMSYHVNDGLSLSAVPDDSVDFVFSFDSLVHAGPDVCRAYLRQIVNKLTPEGCCFLHHSNLGKYQDQLGETVDYALEHWRDREMTGDLLLQHCEEAGLCCFRQELVNWRGTPWLIDGFSSIALPDSRWAAPTAILLNYEFMSEASSRTRHQADSEA